MQLEQPSKFSVLLLFKTRSIGSIGMHTCELGLCAFFGDAEKFRCLWELHALFSEGVYMPLAKFCQV